MLHNLKFAVIMAMSLTLMFACKVRTPKGIIGESEMEELLYEYHVAQAIAQDSAQSARYTELYTEAVLQKHNVSREAFNRSMEYYSQHADLLYDIYDRLGKRFQNEMQAMGENSLSSRYSALSAEGDTANIWTSKNYCLLVPCAGKNLFSFHIEADTSFHPKDRFEWHFNTQFVYKEGRKTAQAVIAIQYDNDSVFSAAQTIYGEGENILTIQASNFPIKKIEGFLYLDETRSETVKLLFVSGNSLIRFHSTEKPSEKPDEASSQDSIANREETLKKSFIDSIQRTSVEKDTSDHFGGQPVRKREIPHSKR